MTFDLSAYEPVADRLARFWVDHPTARVLTELTDRADGVVTFRATVWFDKAEPVSTATGWASEVVTDRGVNATSALENCETSAIGRALANCNYAPKAARPSREEMAKVLPADQRMVADAFEDEIGKCKTPEELTDVGKSVAKAVNSKDITKAQFDRLVLAGAIRRAELTQAAA